ncbi:serine protease [Candidatus Uhrbacteria bacterium]|nr:serine protease [Candidatus Uhrbacteria bacterium]
MASFRPPFTWLLFSLLVGAASGFVAASVFSLSLDRYADSLLASFNTATIQGVGKAPILTAQLLNERVRRSVVDVYQNDQVGENFPPALAFAHGVALSSDGWILLPSMAAAGSYNTASILIGGALLPIEQIVQDDVLPVVYAKVSSAQASVVPLGEALTLSMGEEVFVMPSSQGGFFSTAYGWRWRPALSFSADTPTRHLLLSSSADMGPGSTVFSSEGKLLGLMIADDAGIELLPIDFILPSLRSLLKNGVLNRASLGLTFIDLGRSLSSKEQTSETGGALVKTVVPFGAAAAAGIQPGDIIMSVDGVPMTSDRSLDELLLPYDPLTTVTIRFKRGTVFTETEATLGSLMSEKTQ